MIMALKVMNNALNTVPPGVQHITQQPIAERNQVPLSVGHHNNYIFYTHGASCN